MAQQRLHQITNMLLLLILIIFINVFLSSTFELNNQIHLAKKLNPLRSYKDVQIFRYQIPEEISNAIFTLNASQSDFPINNTFGIDLLKNVTHLSKLTPMTQMPNDTLIFWQWINMTKITIYTDKVLRFYNSIITTACKKPLDVKFYLRWGSLPLLSIKNASIPENFAFKNESNQFEVNLKTNGQTMILNITNPLPGDWYGIAFINKVNDKISQKGLERECYYRFMSSLSLQRLDRNPKKVVTILPISHLSFYKQSLVIDHQDQEPELLFKYFPNLQEYGIKIIITDCQFRPSTNLRHHSPSNPMLTPTAGSFSPMPVILNKTSITLPNNTCPIELNFRALALPTNENREFSYNCHSNNTNVELNNDKCIIDLPSYTPNEWNYLQIIPSINLNSEQSLFEIRSKLIYGTINFTIQILSGQDAFFYNYFNDQNCQLNTGQSLANNPLSLSNNYNYVVKDELNVNMNNNNPSIIKSKNIGNQKEDFLTARQLENTLKFNTNIKDTSQTEPNNNKKINDILQTGSQTNLKPINGIESLIEEDESELSMDKHNSLSKRSADSLPIAQKQQQQNQQNSLRDRKKGSGQSKNKEERRMKKQKNKNKQKNREKIEKQCQFDPTKIMATLDEDDLANITTFNIMNLTRYQTSDSFEFKYSYLDLLNYHLMQPTPIPATQAPISNNNLQQTKQNNYNFNINFNNPNINSNNFNNFNNFNNQKNNHNSWINGNNPNRLHENTPNNTLEPVFLEVDNYRITLFNFTIIPQYDIGGNLMIDFAISPWTNNSYQNVSAILCLTHNKLPPIFVSSSTLRFDEYCYGYLISNTSTANYTEMGSTLQSIVVPFPQPGTWYCSIFIRCYNEEEMTDDYNMGGSEYGTTCDYANKTSIFLDIHSGACLNSRCLNNGKCHQYLSTGILYSTCSCQAGWKGWICNDGSEALSQQNLLINFLLLTASNAAFIPAIILAACRRYFTESAIYFLTMVSSALYHACGSDYPQSYCVLSIGLLQFADFYTAILSFFVTLITLAHLPPACKSFFHLLGAILIALITQNDRTSLWTFVIPAGIGTLLLLLCWCFKCCRKSCYPPARCWIFSVCPAFIFTIVGLIIYAFFETQDNYAITHSIWHGIVALALFLAIPSMPAQNMPENEDDDDEQTHFMSTSGSSAGGSGKGLQNAKMAHVQEWRPPHTSFKFLHDDIDML